MKKLRNKYFAMFGMLILILTSCNPEQLEIENGKQFVKSSEKNQLIADLVIMLEESARKVEDIELLKKFSERKDLNQTEYEQLVQAMGYKNTKEYESFYIDFNNKLIQLRNEYGTDNLTQEQIQEIILELNSLNLRNDPCNCQRIRRNCIASVTAAALVAQMGCASLDLTIIGGIICHAAVLVVQISESDTCNANAQNCILQCQST